MTELARDIRALDTFLLVIMTAIVLFVTALLIYAMVRHNAKANPTPATFTHNTRIEITWTVVPLVILVVIGAFSLPVLFKQQTIPDADVVVKATGYQWYWGYEYPEHGIAFDSFMLAEDELAEFGYTPRRIPDGHRHRNGRADRRHRRGAGDRSRRDPFLDDPRLRREAGRRSGPALPSCGSRSTRARKASTSASARNCAASITPTCRSPSSP